MRDSEALLYTNKIMDSLEKDKNQKFEAMMRKRMRQLAKIQVVESPPIFKLTRKLMVDILSRLPARTILACTSVHMSWEKTIFTDIDFAKLQFQRSAAKQVMIRPDGPGSLSRKAFLVDILDKDSKVYVELTMPLNDEATWSGTDIVSSCNGLVCLCTFLDRSPIAVWSPLTREYVNIPRNSPNTNVRRHNINPIGCDCSMCIEYDEFESEEPLVASGFGYSLRDEQYKVVRVLGRRRSPASTGIGHGFGGVLDSYTRLGEVYTLGGEEPTWRKTKGFAPQTTHTMSCGTYLKGKFYWVCSNGHDEFEFLASFDFEDEQFVLVAPPPTFKAAKKPTKFVRMKELGGHVSICDFSMASHFDVWMMKEGREQWVKAITVHMWHRGVVEPIKILNKEEILLMEDSKNFVAYNCNSMKLVGRLKLDGTQARYGAIAFVPSFFSLKNVVKEDVQTNVLKITQSVKVKP